jgi:hypothetical protein
MQLAVFYNPVSPTPKKPDISTDLAGIYYYNNVLDWVKNLLGINPRGYTILSPPLRVGKLATCSTDIKGILADMM